MKAFCSLEKLKKQVKNISKRNPQQMFGFSFCGERGIHSVHPNMKSRASIETQIISKNLVFFISLKTQTSLVFGNKKPTTDVVGFFLRRKRDSNPRTCYSQQFSRLPHSTALPFLQKSHQIFSECGCKYRKLF